MPLRFSSSSLVCPWFVVLAGLAACGSDDSGPRDKGSAGAAGASGEGGAPSGAGGHDPSGDAGAADDAAGASAGAGGEGGLENPFASYAFEVLIADYDGRAGLYRVAVSDDGLGETEPVVELPEGTKAAYWYRDGDGVLYTPNDGVRGELMRVPVAGGTPERIQHQLDESQYVRSYARFGETYYYTVGLQDGQSRTTPQELWQRSIDEDGEVTHAELAKVGEPGVSGIYELWVAGDWLVASGYLNGTAGNELFRAQHPGFDEVPLAELEGFSSDVQRAGSTLIYNGTSDEDGPGYYALDLSAASLEPVRLTPSAAVSGYAPQLHSGKERFFFTYRDSAEAPETAVIADLRDLSSAPQLALVHTAEATEDALSGRWSSGGRYLFLVEGPVAADKKNLYVVDTEDPEAAAELFDKQPSSAFSITTTADDRLAAYYTYYGSLWLKELGSAEPAFRVDVLEGDMASNVLNASFTADGLHVVFVLSDGRAFVDDTDPDTEPAPKEVTPDGLLESHLFTSAFALRHGAVLLSAAPSDLGAEVDNYRVYLLTRSATGGFARAEQIPIPGRRWHTIVE